MNFVPFDVLDEIFGYACEGSSQRCLDLGLVCRFWYERFKQGEPLWSITLSQGRRRTPKSWNSYDMARKLSLLASPLPARCLHAIEGESQGMCPPIAEATPRGCSRCPHCGSPIDYLQEGDIVPADRSVHCVVVRSGIDARVHDDTDGLTVAVAVVAWEETDVAHCQRLLNALALISDPMGPNRGRLKMDFSERQFTRSLTTSSSLTVSEIVPVFFQSFWKRFCFFVADNGSDALRTSRFKYAVNLLSGTSLSEASLRDQQSKEGNIFVDSTMLQPNSQFLVEARRILQALSEEFNSDETARGAAIGAL